MSDLLEELLMTRQKRPAPPTTIRPLIELLALPTPQDWEARQTFEEESRIAEKAFRAAHQPLAVQHYCERSQVPPRRSQKLNNRR